MEELLRMGLLDSVQGELQQLLTHVSSDQRQSESNSSKKLHFQLHNCMDVSHETNRVSYMALPANVILNVPLVACVVAEAPFTKTYSYFEVEVLSVNSDRTDSSLIIGAAQKLFAVGEEPGLANGSVGYRPANGRVFQDGVEVQLALNDAGCVKGDKIGCGVETHDDDDDQQFVYFTKNGARVFEIPLDPKVDWFPAVSMSAMKEEIRFLEDAAWRSIKMPTDPRDEMLLVQETGHLSFRPTESTGHRIVSVKLAGVPFDRHFSFFEIEIIAMGKTDEIAIGTSINESNVMPGFSPPSCAYHARAGGIFAGRKSKSSRAPKCHVGDKMGCGIEHKADGSKIIFFTHNSKSFMEAEMNENIPQRMFPAIGMSTKGTGTVCVCIMDPSNWFATKVDPFLQHMQQIDMETTVIEELGTATVDKETARATFTAPVGVAKDAVLVANEPLSDEQSLFEIEILYGSLMTFGLITCAAGSESTAGKHPGFTTDSIGYNSETGKVYVDGQPVKDVGKSTYGERVLCGARMNSEGQQLIYFKKNGVELCELPFAATHFTKLYPAVAMRSAGQILAVRLVNRQLWGCESDACGSLSNNFLKVVDREIIECAICRDILTDPRILPCSIHTFCADCLRSYVAQHVGRRSIPCPVCRNVFTLPPGGVSDLPVNTMVTRLLELRNTLPESTDAPTV